MSKTSTVRPVGGQPFNQHTDKFVIDDDDMESDTVAESDLSQKSRSFLNRVNDRLRKMLNRSPEDSMQDIAKRSLIWLCLQHWKHLYSWERINQKIYIPSKNTGNNLTMKQMFDTSEKLIVGQSDEIYGVTPINWEGCSWKQLSFVSDEEVISLSHAKDYVFSHSVLCFGKMNQNPQSNTVWEDKVTWFKSSPQYRTLDTVDGEPIGIRVEYFPRIHHIAALQQSPRVHV